MHCGVRTNDTSPKDESAAPQYCVYCGKQINPCAYVCVYCGKLTGTAVKNTKRKPTCKIGIVFACLSIFFSIIYSSLNLILGALFAVLSVSFFIGAGEKRGKAWGIIAIIVCFIKAMLTLVSLLSIF